MNSILLPPGSRTGTIPAPASKSMAHRLLILAALSPHSVTLACNELSDDIRATADCLSALGARIDLSPDTLSVTPIPPSSTRHSSLVTRHSLPCGESGSTLRFMLPLVGALGVDADCLMRGRLPDRPLAPFDALLTAHGMSLVRDGATLHLSGRLTPGDYALPGDVSSQFVSGLLMALPLLDAPSTVRLTSPLQSAPYVALTLRALALAGIPPEPLPSPSPDTPAWRIAPALPALPASLAVEGDWSNAAFWLVIGALSPAGITVTGLDPDSPQGDRAILELLEAAGALVERPAPDAYRVARGPLRLFTADASQIPDLVPVLATLAAAIPGTSRIVNAARLRLKESDRLASTAALLASLGVQVEVFPDALTIHGRPVLHPSAPVDPANDHRIAMAAAVAATAADAPLAILAPSCTRKSYPSFFEVFEALPFA